VKLNRRKLLGRLIALPAIAAAVALAKAPSRKMTRFETPPAIKRRSEAVERLLLEVQPPAPLRWLRIFGQSAIPVMGNIQFTEVLPISAVMLIAHRTEPDYGEYGPGAGLHDEPCGRWYYLKFNHSDTAERWREQIAEAIEALS